MNILKPICFFFFLLLVPAMVSAGDGPARVLTINSNASVDKYRMAQEEFKKALNIKDRPNLITDVNLGDKKWKLPDIEEMLYDEDPDLIYCIGSKAYLVANKFAYEKNIVFSSVVNWLRLPVTGKTYGVSNELHAGMEIMLFRYIFPGVKKIGVLYSKKYTGQWLDKARDQAREMGFEIIGQTVSGKSGTLSALGSLLPRSDAFWLISDPSIMSGKENLLKILKKCDAEKKPVFSYHRAFADFGAVLIVSADNRTIGRQAAGIAAEVLSGGKFDDKVQFPAGSHITLNLKNVKAYSLQYSEDALESVNTIIK